MSESEVQVGESGAQRDVSAVEEPLTESIPSATRRAYAADWRQWITWCSVTDRLAMPANGEDLAEYVSHLASKGKAPSTIERAVAAIISVHRAAGELAPAHGLARTIVLAYRAQYSVASHPQRRATPVTVSVLRAMTAVCSPFTSIGIRDRALLVLGFALAARRSDLVALNTTDVTETSAGLDVVIGASYPPDGSRARRVTIPRGSVPRTCPVRTVREWRKILTAAGFDGGPLFIRIDRHGTLGHVATGQGSPDGRLSDRTVARIVARTAIRAGLDPAACWSGHSLRRGMATEAYRSGADTLHIAGYGGWAPGSRALAEYLTEIERWEASPLNDVGM